MAMQLTQAWRLAFAAAVSLSLGAALTLSAADAASISPKQTKKKTLYTLGQYPNALCNDGTPGIYYLRTSSTKSTTWVFYLEGGGKCSSVSECETTRTNNYYFTTSTGWNGKSSSGILSNDPSVNPAFYDANVVKVHYCSQDYYSGAKVPTASFLPGNADTGWWFQGRAIAEAVVEDLTANTSLTNFANAQKIVFSGSSAGGLGIVFTINDLIPLAPAAAAKFLAVDAGVTFELGAFDKTIPPYYISTYNPYTSTVSDGLSLWAGRGDAICASQAVTQDDQAACYNTGFLLNGNYINVPTFVAQSQLDTDQLTQHRWTAKADTDAPHMTYEAEFADTAISQLQSLGPLNQIFAPQRLTHTFFVSDSDYSTAEVFGPASMTTSAAVASWFANPTVIAPSYGTQAGLQ